MVSCESHCATDTISRSSTPLGNDQPWCISSPGVWGGGLCDQHRRAQAGRGGGLREGGLTVPELLFCLHGHFNVRHGEGRKPQAFALSSRSSLVGRWRARCRNCTAQEEQWRAGICSAKKCPRFDVFSGKVFGSGGWWYPEVGRPVGCVCVPRYEQGWRFNLVQPDRTCRRVQRVGTANAGRPDGPAHLRAAGPSRWAPLAGWAGAKCGEKESSHTDPAATQSRFGTRFEYVWPSSAVDSPCRVLATWGSARLLVLMVFRNRLSLKERSLGGCSSCRPPSSVLPARTHYTFVLHATEGKGCMQCTLGDQQQG